MERVLAAAMALAIHLLVQIATMPLAAGQPSPEPNPDAFLGGTAECTVCHAHPQILASTGQARPELLVQPEVIAASVHGDFRCVSCHSELTSSMHAKLDEAMDSCSGCHTEQATRLVEGGHGSPDTQPKLTCVTCHGFHTILDTRSDEFVSRMDRECSTCHTQMGERFYGGNPFGMETHRGRSDVATCWDCHRSHLVLPVDDPRSPVNPANILATCRTCHRDAPQNFADIQVHVALSPLPEDPRLRAVTLYMLIILVGTFAFFGYHTVLQIRHELHRRATLRGPYGGPP